MFPKKAVQSLIGNKVQIEMKGDNAVLEGVLKSVDDYMNIHLENTVEIVNGERKRVLGSVVLRGNNIIIINPV
ncbi:LSM domain-containing protein [Methanosarcinales archaeon]|nr:MAG: LSM domain-containing protein [Methanosarcinales archaeon]